MRDLNPRLPRCKRGTLTAELIAQKRPDRRAQISALEEDAAGP